MLDILAVDPAYQGRGAGSMLVQWGLDLAKDLGFDVGSEFLEVRRWFCRADTDARRWWSNLPSREGLCMRSMAFE